MMNQVRKRVSAPHLLLLAAVLLPALFLNKPFHQEEAVFLNIGDRLPWSYFGAVPQDTPFDGHILSQLSPYESTHPSLIPYLLKLIGILADGAQPRFWLYHLCFLVFPLAAIAAALSLARNQQAHPLPLLFLVATPAFLVTATSLMTDLALTAFWLAAYACQQRHDQNPSRTSALCTFLCCCGAMLCGYQGIALPVLMLCYAFYRKRPTCLWPPLASLGFMALYLLAIYLQSGFFPGLTHTSPTHIGTLLHMGLDPGNQRHKLMAMLIQLGFNLLPATPWLIRGQTAKRSVSYGWLSLIISWLWFELIGKAPWMNAYSSAQTLILRLFFVVGCYWCISLAARIPSLCQGREATAPDQAAARLYLMTFFCVVAYNLLLMPYINARYLLPGLAAAILATLTQPTKKEYGHRLPLLLAMLLSIGCAYLDQARARSDRALFKALETQAPQKQGLYYHNDHALGRYLAHGGAQYLESATTDLPAGSLLLWTGKPLHPELARHLKQIKRFQYQAPLGLTLYGPGSGGGFYSSHEGLLPLARSPLLQEAILFERTP